MKKIKICSSSLPPPSLSLSVSLSLSLIFVLCLPSPIIFFLNLFSVLFMFFNKRCWCDVSLLFVLVKTWWGHKLIDNYTYFSPFFKFPPPFTSVTFTPPADSSFSSLSLLIQVVSFPGDFSCAVAGLIFLEYTTSAQWSAELLVITYGGGLKSYLVR